MIKIFLYTAILLFAPIGAAWADDISADKAKSVATSFVKRHGGGLFAKGVAKSRVPIDMVSESKGYFAFNMGEKRGFVIVAKDDDCGMEILGYSDEGSFDLQGMPDGMRWLLSLYDEQVGRTSSMRNISVPQAYIPPLMKTKWGQRAPYNNMCPQKMNESGQMVHCVTGCAATSLAQVMRYHQWPEKGDGDYNGYDFSQSTYDWDNMQDVYDYYYDENGKHSNVLTTMEQDNAVAMLMRDCGTAINMNYGIKESGAMQADVVFPLYAVFGYDRDIKFLNRSYFSADEWITMIYNELKANRPVVHRGDGRVSSHSFVCDGYDNGLLHINWGWNGHSDGYFALGNFTDYNETNYVVVGVRPKSDVQTYASLLGCNKFVIDEGQKSISDDVTLEIRRLTNFGNRKETGTIGLKIVSSDGEVTYVNSTTTVDILTKQTYSELQLVRTTINLSEMPDDDGVYRVTPAYCSPEGEWSDILWYRVPYDGRVYTLSPITESYQLTRFGNKMVIEQKRKSSNLTATMDVPDVWYENLDIIVTGKVTATGGNYKGIIKPAIYNGTYAIPDVNNIVEVRLNKGESMDYRFSIPKQMSGMYKISVFDNDLMVVADPKRVLITSDLFEDDVSEIEVSTMDRVPVVYNTMGVKLNAEGRLPKGIYIINGKKRVVR